MTPRVQRAIDTLLDAINNRTLAKGNCYACAVGNLVARGLGAEIENTGIEFKSTDPDSDDWTLAFMTSNSGQSVFPAYFKHPKVVRCVGATEFSLEELMKIEFSFEQASEIDALRYDEHTDTEILADQIKGIEAVLKVMISFDDIDANIQEVFTSKVRQPITC